MYNEYYFMDKLLNPLLYDPHSNEESLFFSYMKYQDFFLMKAGKKTISDFFSPQQQMTEKGIVIADVVRCPRCSL
jgi:hypothetical protein